MFLADRREIFNISHAATPFLNAIGCSRVLPEESVVICKTGQVPLTNRALRRNFASSLEKSGERVITSHA